MKIRADKLVTMQFPEISRGKAQRLIMSGVVFNETKRIEKAGEELDTYSVLTIKIDPSRFVSRGGEKLEKAIQVFGLRVEGKTCIDIGASTGGFTDCMLQQGAKKVYAVDVGYGQLDWKIRNDQRVIVMERTNARYLNQSDFDEKLEFGSIDVSFISTSLIMPAVHAITSDSAEIVVLIKPQFEAGKHVVNKKGIIRDAKVHKNVIEKLMLKWSDQNWFVKGLDFSPITGAKGNIEFLAVLCKQESENIALSQIDEVVVRAHSLLLG